MNVPSRLDWAIETVPPVGADEALSRAWNLGMDEDGWSEAVMDEADLLLPMLIEMGYAEEKGNTWNFTDKGVTRARELGLWGQDVDAQA